MAVSYTTASTVCFKSSEGQQAARRGRTARPGRGGRGPCPAPEPGQPVVLPERLNRFEQVRSPRPTRNRAQKCSKQVAPTPTPAAAVRPPSQASSSRRASASLYSYLTPSRCGPGPEGTSAALRRRFGPLQVPFGPGPGPGADSEGNLNPGPVPGPRAWPQWPAVNIKFIEVDRLSPARGRDGGRRSTGIWFPSTRNGH